MNEYYNKPDLYGVDTNDIARMIADRTDKSLFKELEECLYHIKACAQNEFNSDYWRVFYNALCKITEQEETK